MGRKVTLESLEELKRLEGLDLVAKKDIAGVWTLGHGHTGSVAEGQTITPAGAGNLLIRDLEASELKVERLVHVQLNDYQFAALVFFDFNTGELENSTLLKKLNTGDYNSVPEELMRWTYAKNPKSGKKEKANGLVNRRAAEVAWWSRQNVQIANSNTVALPATPQNFSKENIGWAAGIIASLGSVGSLFEGAGPVQYALAAVIITGLAVGLFYFIKRRFGK